MHIEFTYTYPASLDRVLDMLRDKEFRRVRVGGHAEFGALTSQQEGDDTVVISEMTPSDKSLPDFAKPLVKKGARVFLTERVSRIDDNTGRVLMSVTAKGIPVSAEITLNLSEQSGSTTAHAVGAVNVNVPLVGRKIEAKVAPKADRFGVYEARAALKYLEAHEG